MLKKVWRRGAAFALSAGFLLSASGGPTVAQKKSTTAAGAQSAARFTPQRSKDATRHSNDAARVLREVMSVPERAIPRDLLEGAEAVAVCPGVLSAAFIVGGRKGDCVISRRTLKRGWGAPVFYNMAGGSFGAQIGGQKTDFVLLFMNDEALK
ncbi:MAG TPA: lipid-binding SYLF domain-containing protein, partial [Pyrinomonadaceae bacterium]|nr:lipid-binding SYLF domain-containing protein [Pyrinomonadaceae bacterium]